MKGKYILLAGLMGVMWCSASWAETYLVSDPGDSGPFTLRQAIIDANNHPGQDTIEIFLAGAINLASNLPLITDSVEINTGFDVSIYGFSGLEHCFSVPDIASFKMRGVGIRGFGGAAVYISNVSEVVLERNTLENNGGGFFIESSRNVSILYNTIKNNTQTGIYVDDFETPFEIRRNLIQNNAQGIFVAGSGFIQPQSIPLYLHIIDNMILSNHDYGIRVAGGVVWTGPYVSTAGVAIGDNTVDGSETGVSLEYAHSINVFGNDILNNATGLSTHYLPGYIEVSNNRIKFNKKGMVADLFCLFGSLAGAGAIADNDIAYNSEVGLEMTGGGRYSVYSNDITYNGDGIIAARTDGDISQNTIKYNKKDGVKFIEFGYSMLGANEIAGNENNGVTVSNDIEHIHMISRNKIYGNKDLGIDLGDDGVTPNDAGDLDDGPNTFLNFPELVSAVFLGNELQIQLDLDVSSVNTEGVHIEFFANPSGADSSGYGEGEIYLGIQAVTVGTGSSQHTVTIPLPAGFDALNLKNISATTTKFSNNGFNLMTSEFSEVIQLESHFDLGDAPDTGEGTGHNNYRTLLSNGGAYHKINSSIHLGQCVDMEIGFLQNFLADADDKDAGALPDDLKCAVFGDDEDGVAFLNNPVAGQNAKLKAEVMGTGYLNAWMDFNQDGDWLDEGEHIIADQFLTQSGSYGFLYPVPQHARDGKTYARFRYSSQSSLPPTGFAPDGEVEDYLISISVSDQDAESGKGEDPVKWEPVKTGRFGETTIRKGR